MFYICSLQKYPLWGILKDKIANLAFIQKHLEDIYIFISTNSAIPHIKTFIASFKSLLNSHLFFSLGVPHHKIWRKSSCHVFHVSEIAMWALFMTAGGRNLFRSWFSALTYLIMVEVFLKSKSKCLYLKYNER